MYKKLNFTLVLACMNCISYVCVLGHKKAWIGMYIVS